MCEEERYRDFKIGGLVVASWPRCLMNWAIELAACLVSINLAGQAGWPPQPREIDHLHVSTRTSSSTPTYFFDISTSHTC
jgi:hypothetical protein